MFSIILPVLFSFSIDLPLARRGMCFAHVMMNLNKELPAAKIYENACNEIKEDVSILARATCYDEFQAGPFCSFFLYC